MIGTQYPLRISVLQVMGQGIEYFGRSGGESDHLEGLLRKNWIAKA